MPTITLSDGTITATLTDKAAFGIRPNGIELGMPERNRVFAQPWGHGFAPLAGVTSYNRQATIRLYIRGASLAAWNTNYQAVTGLLKQTSDYWETGGTRGTACSLSILLDGQTNATIYDVLAGELDASMFGQDAMGITTGPRYTDAELKLILKPFGRPVTALSATSSELTNGGGTSGGAAAAMRHSFTPVGDQDAPMRMYVQGTTSQTRRRIILGRKSRTGASNFIPVLHGEVTASTTGTQSSYPGYTVTIGGGLFPFGSVARTRTADASYENGAYMAATGFPHQAASAGVSAYYRTMAWRIDDNASAFYGAYRCYLRVANASNGNNNASNSITFHIGYGGNSATDKAFSAGHKLATGITITTPQVWDMGTITIPLNPDIPASHPSTGAHWIGLVHHTGGDALFNGNLVGLSVDALYLIPADEEFLDLQGSASGNEEYIIDDIAPRPYQTILTSASGFKGEVVNVMQRTPIRVRPGADNYWYAMSFQSTGSTTPGALTSHSLTDTFTVRTEYFPNYDLFATGS